MENIDPTQVRKYLLSFDTFVGAPQEAINYVHGALRRFLITLDMVPRGGTGQRLLELGAGPYYITLLLKKYRRYELELANYFGDSFPNEDEQTISSAQFNEKYIFRFRNFNAERDVFPYADESFDVVLCCEIIEHLTLDPTHMLCEIHRVLKPGGCVLVTTPNVLNLAYVLKLLRGDGNIFHPYSGYGVYGRHQREYMLAELTDLIRGVGYEIAESRLEDIYSYPRMMTVLKKLRPAWRDNVFVLARKSGMGRYYYPPSLYISTHAIRRVVSSDVQMGWNDIGHLGVGWWPVELIAGTRFRWTTDTATVYLVRPPGRRRVRLEVNAGPVRRGSIELTVSLAGGEHIEQPLDPNMWHEVVLPLAPSSEPQVELMLGVDRTWNPAAIGLGPDNRELGIMVRRIQLTGD